MYYLDGDIIEPVQAFNDEKARADIMYYLALLAYHESNWQQCVLLLQELQARGPHYHGYDHLR